MVVFVDTNVLIYRRDGAYPVEQSVATDWIERLWHDRSGRVSTQVLSEYFTNVTRRVSRPLPEDQAWADVQALLSWNPHAVDVETLSRARAVHLRYRASWWDSLIVAAAQLQGCDLLLTEDLQDGMRFDELTVRNPFRLSVEEAQATYARPAPQRARRTRVVA